MPKNYRSRPRIFDTNIFLRFITGDNPKFSPEAKQLFIRAQKGEYKIYLDELVFGEIVWTLQSFYDYTREEIRKNLGNLLNSNFVVNPRKRLMKKALEKYVMMTNLSFSDCWIYELSNVESMRLETFDKGLSKQVKN
ncbi:PIN domain-containing protein [Candidatus Collierbacteria bacterium]|nr:PIN domain-containing protein [Candidatus Collierbacteria bacterium]